MVYELWRTLALLIAKQSRGKPKPMYLPTVKSIAAKICKFAPALSSKKPLHPRELST